MPCPVGLLTITKLVDPQPVIELSVCDAVQYKPTAIASPDVTWLAVDTETAVAEKALFVLGGWRSPGRPAPLTAIVTEAGTVSRLLLLASVIAVPAGTGSAKVTVQVLAAPWPRLVGLQVSPDKDTGTGACRLTVAVCELVPKVAITATV